MVTVGVTMSNLSVASAHKHKSSRSRVSLHEAGTVGVDP